jgi:hypothetical protein
MPKRPERRDGPALLASVAAALTSCEQAGLKVRLRHGGVIETSQGYVVRGEGEWVARSRGWHPFSQVRDDISDED